MNLQRKFHFFYKYFIFLVYFVANILFLSQFPFIHSDESWLSGLSRAIMHLKSPAVTEPFFDIMPRFPHAIKILFHFLQVPFLSLFSYSPFAVRLLSLTAGTAALILLSRLFKRWAPDVRVPLTILLAVDIQFIYAAHFALQEILLVLCLVLSLYLYGRGRESGRAIWNRLSAVAIGLSIGIHPNSFLISLPLGAFLLTDLVLAAVSAENDNSGLKPAVNRIIEYILILALFAAFFAGLSYLMDPQFLVHYRSFGESVGVSEPLYMKFFRFPDFYAKLFYRISGTYYTPAIKLQFYLFGTSLACAPIVFLLHPPARLPITRLITALILINIGTLFMGKYSQPSIILHFPLYYLLTGVLLQSVSGGIFTRKSGPCPAAGDTFRAASPAEGRAEEVPLLPRPRSFRWNKRAAAAIAALLVCASLINTGSNLAEEFHIIGPKKNTAFEDYRDYLGHIEEFVPRDAMVLANLNSEYYFDYGKLRDYRNLIYLDRQGISFENYIRSNGIEYILYPEEMDLIYERRPVWNILYGNVYGYYHEMQLFLKEKCEPAGEFRSPVYGMRITKYSGTRDWKVKVYKVR